MVGISYDDVQPERMTPGLQKAEMYWKILGQLHGLHPVFFGKEPNTGRRPGVSVIISCYNQRRTLEMALESFFHQEMLPVEVIVADDGSDDDTLEWLDGFSDERWPFPVRYITRKHSWYRLASLNNSAANLSKGTRLLFTNADQVHCPTSIRDHAALPNNKVGAGIFKGISTGHSNKVTIEMIREFQSVERLGAEFPSGKTNTVYIGRVDPNVNPIVVWGGNFSVPWKTFEAIGGYDGGYDVGWGGEENDLVARCVKSGTSVQWVNGSVIYHLDHPIKVYAKKQLGTKRYLKR